MQCENQQQSNEKKIYTLHSNYYMMRRVKLVAWLFIAGKLGVKWNDRIINLHLVASCWKHQHYPFHLTLHFTSRKKNKVINFSEMNMKKAEFNWTCRKIGIIRAVGAGKRRKPWEKWKMVNCLISREALAISPRHTYNCKQFYIL